MDPINNHAAQLLAGYVQRLENLNEDAKAIADDKKVVMAEAKAAGLDPKVIREVLKRRKVPKPERDEFEDLVNLYWGALGGT